MERRIRLGELLIRAGLITELQLKAALAEQRRWGGRLGRILVDMNFISEDILVKGLARLLGVQRADFSSMNVPESVLGRFDANDCQNRGYLPLRYNPQEKKVLLAMVDVNDLALIDELRFKHGFSVEPAIAGEHALLEKVRAVFFGANMSRNTQAPEGGMKLIDNQGSTRVKSRSQIEAEHHAMMRQKGGAGAAPQQAQPSQAPAPAPAQGFGTPAQAQVAPAPAQVAPAPPMPNDLSAQLSEIEVNQKRQARAIKTVVELLIQKGVFSRDQFLATVNKR